LGVLSTTNGKRTRRGWNKENAAQIFFGFGLRCCIVDTGVGTLVGFSSFP
jgi:uncharacterized membrane protein YcgQ (UPF0703/DUF1980 family)